MATSESKPKGNAKYDYTDEGFLSTIESYAKKGFTDKEIAYALGLCPTYFSEKKNQVPELSDVLVRGRATINAAVRAKFLAMAMGGIKTKSVTKRALRNEDGELTGETEIQTVEGELAPSLQAMTTWLYHHDEDWRKVERREDEDDDVPSNIEHGIEIDNWIKDQVK